MSSAPSDAWYGAFTLGVRRNGDFKRKKIIHLSSPSHKRHSNGFNYLRIIFQDLIDTALTVKHSNQKQKQEKSKTELEISDALSHEGHRIAEEDNNL